MGGDIFFYVGGVLYSVFRCTLGGDISKPSALFVVCECSDYCEVRILEYCKAKSMAYLPVKSHWKLGY